MKTLLCLFLGLFFAGCAAHHQPMTTVQNFDINRYMGQWYEIAKYPNRFQEGCPLAKAIYTYDKERVHVNNICMNEDGKEIRRAKGVANIVSDGKLEVSFFWPFYGDYWVIMLGDEYQYSVVGEPKREYLWILSRTQNLSKEDKKEILSRLEDFGYTQEKLIWNNY